jgi:hypothetical protein
MRAATRSWTSRLAGWISLGLGLATAAYAGWVGAAWFRYGRRGRLVGLRDRLLDDFMPEYDVAERHFAFVAASPEVTLLAAEETDLDASPLIRTIFRARAALLGARPDDTPRARGLLAFTQSIGWGVLADLPGREIVMGAVTQPWMPSVVFRALPPAAFRDFRDPGYVKIVWTLRADPADAGHTVFRTETRAVATDPAARARFRWYWARFSPGIILIRRLMLIRLRKEAERRATVVAAGTT